ncbi:MAG: peptide ABC transporter substrate-binding protein [Chloroflexi bacterium]|nr:peptide ABC transporter substrate-binding protein [Chloroflexota bacterium]
MYQRRIWPVLSLLLITSLLVTACTSTTQNPSASAGGAADPNGELVTNMGGEPDTIDPHKAQFNTEIGQVMMVFEGLMTLDPATLKPIPAAAAKDPEISADGLTWKVTLKDGLKFSDGTPLTAKDFAFGFTRTCDPATAGDYSYVLYVIAGCEAWNGMNVKKATPAELSAAKAKLGVKANSDKEIQFTLAEPAAYFRSILYMWVGMPARESDVTKGGDKWTEPATYIGNGPFKLTEWKHSEKMVFERNDSYRTPAKLKKWTKVMIGEGAVAFAAYRNNELDVNGISAEDLRAVDSDADLKSQLVDVGGAATFYYGFNVAKPPFNDANLRLAFAKSFDREAYIRDVQKIGKPVATGGFIPPGIPGYDKDDTIQKYDVAEAKKLFDAASPAAKDALKGLKFTYGSSARTKTRVEWVTQQWKTNLGVDIGLDPVDRTAFTALTKKPETTPQLFSLGWIADFPDQQNWHTTVWISKTGISSKTTGYSNPEFDRIVRAADKEQDPKKRDDAYLQAGKILSKDAPAAWIYYDASKYLKKPWVKGVTDTAVDSVLGEFRLYEIYVTKKG